MNEAFDYYMSGCKKLVKKFFGDCTDYKKFWSFSFDWLNHYKNFEECRKKDDLYEKLNSKNIEDVFKMTTGLTDSEKELIGCICPIKYRKYPYGGKGLEVENKRIVKCIIAVLFEDEIKKIFDEGNDEEIKKIKEIKEPAQVSENDPQFLDPFLDLFGCDIMYSIHNRIGNAVINNDRELKSKKQYIFLYDKIDQFNKSKSKNAPQNRVSEITKKDEELFQGALKFYNLHHTLGNIIILPAKKGEKKKQTFNQYKGTYNHDDFGAFLIQLEKLWLDSSQCSEGWSKLFEANNNFFDAFGSFQNYCERNYLDVELIKIIQAGLDEMDKAGTANRRKALTKYINVVCECIIQCRGIKMLNDLQEKVRIPE